VFLGLSVIPCKTDMSEPEHFSTHWEILISHIFVKKPQPVNNWQHCACLLYFTVPDSVFIFSHVFFLLGEIWGGDLRSLVLPEFGHCCWALCKVQAAGGAVDYSGPELAVFSARWCSCHQPQVRDVMQSRFMSTSTFTHTRNMHRVTIKLCSVVQEHSHTPVGEIHIG